MIPKSTNIRFARYVAISARLRCCRLVLSRLTPSSANSRFCRSISALSFCKLVCHPCSVRSRSFTAFCKFLYAVIRWLIVTAPWLCCKRFSTPVVRIAVGIILYAFAIRFISFIVCCMAICFSFSLATACIVAVFSCSARTLKEFILSRFCCLNALARSSSAFLSSFISLSFFCVSSPPCAAPICFICFSLNCDIIANSLFIASASCVAVAAMFVFKFILTSPKLPSAFFASSIFLMK